MFMHDIIYIFSKATTKYISSGIFYSLITMPDDYASPVRTRIARHCHPLDEARHLAEAILFQLVLLCMLLGFCRARPEGKDRQGYGAVRRTCRVLSPGIRGILPVIAGTAGYGSRAFLHS
jgi:hypothetical protein